MQHGKLDEQREAFLLATLVKPESGPNLVAVASVEPSTELAVQTINVAGVRQATKLLNIKLPVRLPCQEPGRPRRGSDHSGELVTEDQAEVHPGEHQYHYWVPLSAVLNARQQFAPVSE